ncbi:hypothetical protein ACT3CE_01650 [Marinifilum sp. RC60d5]|uniref:hypothetical protein n=1 Tax=Marinifilum sp. RC60d5 TaxID=3458414 RepID=UPI0040370306
MDRIIAKKPWYQQRKKWYILISVLAIILLYSAFFLTLKKNSFVNKDKVCIGEVKVDFFHEYIYKRGIVEEGRVVLSGEKTGSLSLTNNFKISILLDAFYINRLDEGVKGTFRFKKKDYHLVVEKVYPEIRSGQFEIELKFIEEQPQNICVGQAFKIKIEFDKARKALLVPRGDFCQTTNGQWIFVLDSSCKYAIKRSIKMGGKNPKYYEILDGLVPGEKVLLNSYDLYGDSEKLLLK